MRIVVVTQYFWPETFLINNLTKTLVEQGHEVTVLTGKPNYPDGVVFDGYRQQGVEEEQYDGQVRVLRVPLRPRGQGAVNLFRNYLSFVISGLRHFPRLARDLNPDVILVYVPSPITGVVPAILLRRRKKAHLAVWVQDLWPESLSATGYIRQPAILRMVEMMVRAIFARCDTLLVQSRAFVEPVARLADRAKIVYYPNSMPDPAASQAVDEPPLPAELLSTLTDHTCVVFAGNIGSAQAVDTIIDAAEQVRDLPAFRIVFVGSGSRLEGLRQACADRKLDNVTFAGRFPAHAMPAIFTRAAGLLVTLKKEPILAYTVPSKVQAYLAAGRPIIAALDGEGRRIIEDAGAGLGCPAEDSAALARCLRDLHGMPDAQRTALGEAGRRYFLEHFEMTKLARQLTDILQDRAGGTDP